MRRKCSRRDEVTRQLVGKDGAELWSERITGGTLLDNEVTLISINRRGNVFVARTRSSKQRMIAMEHGTKRRRDRFMVLAFQPNREKTDVFIVDDLRDAFIETKAWNLPPLDKLPRRVVSSRTPSTPRIVFGNMTLPDFTAIASDEKESRVMASNSINEAIRIWLRTIS